MATTAIIAEMIVIGFFTLIWICLGISALYPCLKTTIYAQLVVLKDFSAFVTGGVIIVCYQFGWLVDAFSYWLYEVSLEKWFKKKLFNQYNYDLVRATILVHGSQQVNSDIAVDRSVVRLSRAGVLNFCLIGVACLFIDSPVHLASGFSFFLTILSAYLWYERNKQYYKRMIAAYCIIIKKSGLPTEKVENICT